MSSLIYEVKIKNRLKALSLETENIRGTTQIAIKRHSAPNQARTLNAENGRAYLKISANQLGSYSQNTYSPCDFTKLALSADFPYKTLFVKVIIKIIS